MNKLIYLDHNATTPVHDEALAAMLPYFTQHYGNASSKTHAFGWIAEQAIDTAQLQAASLIGAQKEEIIFTSGATESINLALKGLAAIYGNKKNHIITNATEHLAVLETLDSVHLHLGFEITILPVNRAGQIDLDDLKNAIKPQTLMISCMHANNETGTIFPIKEIGKIAHENNTLFFCDATQSAGKIAIDVIDDEIDLLCFSAHKMYGPKGVGALYVNRKKHLKLLPQIEGGGHQNAIRSGTLNVPGIVGFGKACEIAQLTAWDDGIKISRLRTILEQRLTLLPNTFINGDIKNRLYNTTNICFKNKSAAEIIKALKNVAVSNGSACASAKATASHVLLAMGLTENEAQSSIRFSFGKSNTLEEVEFVVDLLSKAL
jgi:cysteine desulfurase